MIVFFLLVRKNRSESISFFVSCPCITMYLPAETAGAVRLAPLAGAKWY